MTEQVRGAFVADVQREGDPAIASRYLGPDAGAELAAGPGQQDDTVVRIRVQTWRTLDFTKIGS